MDTCPARSAPIGPFAADVAKTLPENVVCVPITLGAVSVVVVGIADTVNVVENGRDCVAYASDGDEVTDTWPATT
jgi:hypothetical protein